MWSSFNSGFRVNYTIFLTPEKRVILTLVVELKLLPRINSEGKQWVLLKLWLIHAANLPALIRTSKS